MWIKNLSLKNFRNYECETISFGDGLNVLYGKNGQGKTNAVEAVYYLCCGTSFRAKRDRQLIRQGCDFSEISLVAGGRYGDFELYAKIYENKRELRLNGSRVKNSEMIGNLYSVFFSPRELRLIQDGPDERRRFLNISISQLHRQYFVALTRYNKILEQRNNLLKDRDVSSVRSLLPVWDEQLSRYAAFIICERREYMRNLSSRARDVHSFLTNSAEELEISLEREEEGTEDEIRKRLYDTLERTVDRDLRLGFTGTGPHRDDMDIKINGRDAKLYASQGQTRTAALAIKLAEVDTFESVSGERPVLILDDVMSELDPARRRKLVLKTDDTQCLLTCTHAERELSGKNSKRIKIEAGKAIGG